MAVSAFKTFSAGEVLTASDLNSSFAQVFDNGEDLGFPATQAVDIDGQELILDADADTSITADTDDRIDFRMSGVDYIQFRINDGDGEIRVLSSDAGATPGPWFVAYRNSASAAAGDGLGSLRFDGNDSGGAQQTYAQIASEIEDHTAAAEDGRLVFRATLGGIETDHFRIGPSESSTNVEAGAYSGSTGAEGPHMYLWHDTSSPADNDVIGRLKFYGQDSAANRTEYASVRATSDDVTDATEDGKLDFAIMQAGSLTDVLQLTSGGSSETYVQIADAGAGATAGPILALWRNSSSPADNDLLGQLQFRGEDDGSNQVQYAAIQGIAEDVTDATEDGAMAFQIMLGGTVTEISRINGTTLLVGKTSGSISTVGFQAGTSGRSIMTMDGNAPLQVNRLTSDGDLILFHKDDAEVGDITVAAGTVSLTGFTGAHASDFVEGLDHPDAELPPFGTLLSAVDTPLDELHPRVKVTDQKADPAIYGVYAGIKKSGFVQVWSAGIGAVRVIGPVKNGDLLEASEIPGVARRQKDTVMRSSTVGKVTRGDDRTDERLVPCTLHCG